MLRTGWDNQTTVVPDGRVDVSYVRLPVDQRGRTLEPLSEEPRVLVMPAASNRVCLAWSAASRSPLLRESVALAQRVHTSSPVG